MNEYLYVMMYERYLFSSGPEQFANFELFSDQTQLNELNGRRVLHLYNSEMN